MSVVIDIRFLRRHPRLGKRSWLSSEFHRGWPCTNECTPHKMIPFPVIHERTHSLLLIRQHRTSVSHCALYPLDNLHYCIHRVTLTSFIDIATRHPLTSWPTNRNTHQPHRHQTHPPNSINGITFRVSILFVYSNDVRMDERRCSRAVPPLWIIWIVLVPIARIRSKMGHVCKTSRMLCIEKRLRYTTV